MFVVGAEICCRSSSAWLPTCPCCPDSITFCGSGADGWRGGGQQREGGMMASVHKKSPRICQLINQGRFGGERSLPASSWLVRVYLFRVTHGQSRLTSNYQEQPQLRPSINKKCIMKVGGQSAGWRWAGEGGRDGARRGVEGGQR